MSRRSSRSSRSTQLYSTTKPASADISFVFADSIQVGTSPGVAAATLPRQSVPEASSSLFDRPTLERVTKGTASSFVPRPTPSLLSNMYFSKWRQHPTAIPRTERVIQTETWSSAELPRVPLPSDHEFDSAQITSTPESLRFAIPDAHLNAGLPPDPTTSPTSPQASRLDAKLGNSITLGLSPGTDSVEPISSIMPLQDAEGSYLVNAHHGPDYLECPNISNETVEPQQMKVDPTNLEMTSGAFSGHGVLQQADNCPDQMHGNQVLSDSGESSPLVDPVIKSDSHSANSFSKFPLYLPSSLLPKQFFSSGPKEEVKYIEDHLKNSTTENMTSMHNDKLGSALEIHSEGSRDDIPAETSPIEKSSSLPSSTWSDYLRLTTATIPKLRPTFSNSMVPPGSPPLKEYFDPCDIQVTSHTTQPSNISSHSWFAPWTWWHVNTGFSSNTESVAVPINPEGDFKGLTHAKPIGTKSLFAELANPIDADRETRVGWLSVLTMTNARQRALKEEGEIMEVVTVAEGLSSIKPGTSEDINIQPESRSNVSILKSALPKDSTFPSSSKRSTTPSPSNLVLPTFEDAFCNPPRSTPLPKEKSTLHRTVNYVAKMLFHDDATAKEKGKGKEKEPFGQELPKAWSVLGEDPKKVLEKVKRVVVIGIHGWFPRAFVRQVLGEVSANIPSSLRGFYILAESQPTGTSEKFAMMLERTVKEFFDEYGVTLDKITKIVLQGEGTVAQRVNKWVPVFLSKTYVGEGQSADVIYSLFQEYLNHEDWVNDLQTADAILFGTHSQGSIVTTQLVDRLINEGHIRTPNSSLLSPVSVTQRVGVLALCGVHNGPLLYLNTSSFVNPYIQYFESAAARELFEFQDSESPASRNYITALSNCLNHGVKFTYIASLDDQVVPIYSGAFVNATHPLILRALYIDGDAYHSSDFLSNLLVLLFKIRNAGLHDNGLIAHLSEATAGSLTGLGHSTAYEEPASYKLAVRFLFETSDLIGSDLDLFIEPFTARAARNDYEIPWVLRDLIANPDVAALFASEFSGLRSAFDDWHPRTAVLRDIRRKLEPIRRLNTSKL